MFPYQHLPRPPSESGGLAKLPAEWRSGSKHRRVKIRIFVSAGLERKLSGRVHPNAARADSWRRPGGHHSPTFLTKAEECDSDKALLPFLVANFYIVGICGSFSGFRLRFALVML